MRPVCVHTEPPQYSAFRILDPIGKTGRAESALLISKLLIPFMKQLSIHVDLHTLIDCQVQGKTPFNLCQNSLFPLGDVERHRCWQCWVTNS